MSFLEDLNAYRRAPSSEATRRAVNSYEAARRDSAGEPEAITTLQTALNLMRFARPRSPEIEALEQTISIDLAEREKAG